MKALYIILLAITLNAQTTTQKSLLYSYTALHAYDLIQTEYAISNNKAIELNPLMQKTSYRIIGKVVLVSCVYYIFGKAFEHKTLMLVVANLTQLAVVGNNQNIISWNIAF